ncbi:methionine ABC transporter permease [Klebsiella variicola]|nr:methionine ABC transporter permease [Klebsiella variicola]
MLLCDEATSALDPETTASVLALLADINQRLNLTIVLITHQLEVVKTICDHAALLEQGEIVESGKLADLLVTPWSRLRQSLLHDPQAEQDFLTPSRRSGEAIMRSSMSWEDLWPLLLDGTLDTLYMVGLAALFTVLIGLPTGVLLFISRANGLAPMPKLNALLGAVINIGRSLPFIVLLIALIPFTRLIVGTTLGSTAAIVPVTIGAFPFFARLTENALDEVDYGRIEAILSMGGNVWHVIFKSLLPEALPTLLAGITLTIVMLIGFSSMAGVIGGGGLGDLAIRYGYQRFNNEVMFGTVLILVAMVQGVQMAGDRLVAQPGPPSLTVRH